MRIPALILGFLVTCIAVLTGCGDNIDPPRASTKELTSFRFVAAKNAGLAADVTATINGSAIAATVPFGTNVNALVATFDSTGASVTVGGVAQVSGVTANNFSAATTYRVTAEDATTRDYTVTVTVAPAAAKQLTAFAFLDATNAALDADVTATINGTAIAATVPFGTNVTALVATFTSTGTGVTVGGTAQVSGTTPHDFSSPVTYRVTAADGSTQDYQVTVTVALNSAKAITAFSFASAHNAGLPADVAATINGTAIAATVPFGTDVSALVATFSTTGDSVKVGATAQVSGTTANNFTAPVEYTVTAADGSTQVFTVTVTIALNPAKEITSFEFLSTKNAGLPADVTATINGTAIAATVPFGTDVTALVATFSTTGASVKVGATAQVSGMTANNFTAPVEYTVTAADGSTKVFTVTVTIALNPAKEITAYAFLSTKNAGLPADVTATINGTAIAATVPFGTNVTALVATFSTTGESVAVGGTAQASGITANDFTNPVDYTVTAADGSTRTFTVTVTVAENNAKEITAFSFESANNAVLPADVTATINGTAIAATVPFGTDVTALIATFSTTGAGVSVGGTAQTSGTTANDFASPVDYTVTAADGSTKVFTVTVTVALNPAKELTAFSFESANNAVLPADVTATINGTDIAATVPFGTDVTALVATFSTTGASVSVGGNAQTSGTTANDFTNPVTYRVTAADGSTKDFTVTVTIALNPAKELTSFEFLSVDNATLGTNVTATISGTDITATVPFGSNVTALIATFATTGASVSVGATAQVSGITANSFSTPVTYRVTAADGSTKDFTVTVTVAPSPAKDITAFSFTSATNGGVLTANVTAAINGNTITARVPFGTVRTALVATFTSTGAGVTVGGVAQTSAITANDFTNPVAYTVTAADGSTAVFTVTVNVAADPTKAFTSFTFPLQLPNLVVATSGTITGTEIKVEVPPGTNLTSLVANFGVTVGATVTIGGVTQTSGTTANDFTSPLTYTVTAADNTTQDFTVTVTPLVTSFSFTGAAGNEATFTSDGTNSKLTEAPVMSRAGGAGTTAGGAFSGNGWNTVRINLAHYYSFTVTPVAGATMNLTNLALRDQRSGTGPVRFVVRSSLDGFTADLINVASHGALARTDIGLGAGFAAVTTAVEFRFYAFDTTNSGGTWRVDDVQLRGTITP